MRTLSILIPRLITEADLHAMVVELGGIWREDYGIQQGIIDRNGAQTLLSLDNAIIEECFDDEDPPWPRVQMGFDPKSQVVIGVIRYHNPAQDLAARILARDVAYRLSDTWKGYLDWDDVVPP